MSDREYPPVKFIRLKNGDDIVCEVVEIGEDDINNYMLMNPFKVVYMPAGERGYVQIAFMPWVFSRICDKQEFMIKTEDVLLITEVSEYMEKYYWDTIDGPQDEPEDEPDDGLDRLKEVLEQLGIDGKRTLH